MKNFIEIYSAQLEARKRSIVFGDFNLDLLNQSNKNNLTKYINMIKENGYDILNKIDNLYCTRETSTTKTILDHVSTNIENSSFNLSIIESTLSDHKQIFLQFLKSKPHIPKKVPYEAVNYDSLYLSISEAYYVNKNSDFSVLEQFIIQHINTNKIYKYKIMNLPQKDWINKNVINSINARNILGQMLKADSKNRDLENKYLKEKINTNNIIKTSKEKYYVNLFNECIKKPKKMYELINTLVRNKIKDSCAPPKLLLESGYITDGNEVCDTFNNFFARIGSELANKIHQKYHLNSTNTCMYKDSHIHNITLSNINPCTTEEVSKIIDNLDNNTSTGSDGVSTKAIKCIKQRILLDLTKCINRCLKEGTFPDSLKVAKVTPIYKSGPKVDPGNYRPVSVLPIMSKIFERVLYDRLDKYLQEKNFLIEQQYGFRSKSSTLSATIDLVTKIKTNIDQKKIALGIFIDLKKAFDTVSHTKLLLKLRNIGICHSALNIFASYLQNRCQVVKIGNYTSGRQNITYGIPQGSILGPLLFSIYINNIKNLTLTGQLTLYADDTCLFYFGNSIHTLISEAQKDLEMLNEWFLYNLLTINTLKTSYMIFTSKNKKIPNHMPLMINKTEIKRSHSEKYLGLLLDDKLSWKTHIDQIKSKLVSLIGSLWKISNCIPRKIKIIIYNSLVKPHLEYLIEVWGSASKSILKELQISQNKIIKVLFRYNKLTSTETLYKKTNFFNVTQIYTYNTCILIKKILLNLIHSNIKFNNKTYKYNLRNKNKLLLHYPRTLNYGQKNIMFEGAQLYNKLPNEIRDCKSMPVFKKKLKLFIESMV